MLLPEALQEELGDGPILRCEVVFLYSRCLKIFVPVVVNFGEFPFFGLPKWSHTWSPKYFKVNGFEVMERLFIEKEYFLVDMCSEKQPTGASEGEEVEEEIGRRLDSTILVNNLKVSYYGPIIQV